MRGFLFDKIPQRFKLTAETELKQIPTNYMGDANSKSFWGDEDFPSPEDISKDAFTKSLGLDLLMGVFESRRPQTTNALKKLWSSKKWAKTALTKALELGGKPKTLKAAESLIDFTDFRQRVGICLAREAQQDSTMTVLRDASVFFLKKPWRSIIKEDLEAAA